MAGFVGTANFITARVTAVTDKEVSLTHKQTVIVVDNYGYPVQTDETVYLVVRPEAMSLIDEAAGSNINVLRGRIKMNSFLGAKTRYWIGEGSVHYVVDDYNLKADLIIGSEVLLRLDGSKVHILQQGQMEGDSCGE